MHFNSYTILLFFYYFSFLPIAYIFYIIFGNQGVPWLSYGSDIFMDQSVSRLIDQSVSRLIFQIVKSHSIVNITPNAIIVITMCTTIVIYESSEFFQIINTNNSSKTFGWIILYKCTSCTQNYISIFRTKYVCHLHYMYFCIYHVYKSHNADSWVMGHSSFPVFYSYHIPCFYSCLPWGYIKNDSETKISDISSDCSTQILPDETAKCHNMKVHNKLSIIKDYIIIELECKGCISPSGNILCFSSISKPWLDIVKKICSK